MKVTSRSSTSRAPSSSRRPTTNLFGGRVDLEHVPRPGLAQVAKTAALADRVDGGAAVRSELAAGGVDHCAGAHRQPLREVARRLAARDEADLLALSLVGHRQAELSSVLAHLALGHPAEREDDAPEALAVEVIEHVGLVLGRVSRRVQLRTGGAFDDPRVVSRRQLVEAQREHAAEHEVEPDEGVAADARIRRPALQVVAVKRLDDPLAELLLEVPTVIRNAEQRGDATRVLDSIQRAAAGVALVFLSVTSRPLLQGDADNVVALRLKQRPPPMNRPPPDMATAILMPGQVTKSVKSQPDLPPPLQGDEGREWGYLASAFNRLSLSLGLPNGIASARIR